MFDFFARARGSTRGHKFQPDKYEKIYTSSANDFDDAISELNDYIEVRFSPARRTRGRRKK